MVVDTHDLDHRSVPKKALTFKFAMEEGIHILFYTDHTNTPRLFLIVHHGKSSTSGGTK